MRTIGDKLSAQIAKRVHDIPRFKKPKKNKLMTSTRNKARNVGDICADCSNPGPAWASINRGVLICNDCCSVHRSLGRHISQVLHLEHGSWSPSLLKMVKTLVANGANSIWEHSLLDPNQIKSGIRKPNPKDKIIPTKANFIRAKYQMLSFGHRLPVREDDEISTADLSQQLHSSVRTANLETSLRLLSLGAQPNYYFPEKGNCPLHIAANAGQLLQVELLCVHGADPSLLDKEGKSPLDYAMSAGHMQLVERLINLQCEVTDRLTYYLCGRKPDHKDGHKFFIPVMANSCLDLSENAKIAKQKLQLLSNHLFGELSSDVYDEVDRRETDAIWIATQNHSDVVSNQIAVPFLPVNPSYSSTRNQGRQKLALFNAQEFSTLVLDITVDARRREMGSQSNLTDEYLDVDMEEEDGHDYDEVASDNGELEAIKESRSAKNSKVFKEPEIKNEEKAEEVESEEQSSVPPLEEYKDHVPINEYRRVQKSLFQSQEKINILSREKDELLKEITVLQTVVKTLKDQLSQQSNEDHDSSGTTVERTSDQTVEATPEYTNTTSEVCEVGDNEDSEDDLVDVNDIKGYEDPATLIQKRESDSYDNLPQSPPSKSSNDRDSYLHVNDEIFTDSDDNLKQELEDEARKIMDEADSLLNHSKPRLTKEEVVLCTEQITKCIQELLLAAQAGKHSSFIPCSNNISAAVKNMTSLFPENPPVLAVRAALDLMAGSAVRLEVECKNTVLPDSSIDLAQLTQQVIQCAYDIAKAAKELVTTTAY